MNVRVEETRPGFPSGFVYRRLEFAQVIFRCLNFIGVSWSLGNPLLYRTEGEGVFVPRDGEFFGDSAGDEFIDGNTDFFGLIMERYFLCGGQLNRQRHGFFSSFTVLI